MSMSDFFKPVFLHELQPDQAFSEYNRGLPSSKIFVVLNKTKKFVSVKSYYGEHVNMPLNTKVISLNN